MENPKATGFIKYLPNILTFTRLFGSFALLFLMGFERDVGPFNSVPWVWLFLYAFLVITDPLDGFIARRFNAKSSFGAVLDSVSDAVLIVIAAATVFVVFAFDNLSGLQFGLYIGALVFCLANRLNGNIYSKKFFGAANMVHSYPQKFFAASCCVVIGFWAFLRDVPWWSVVILLLLNLYATIDEIVYCARAAKYDVNFRGHGFQKYELKKGPGSRKLMKAPVTLGS